MGGLTDCRVWNIKSVVLIEFRVEQLPHGNLDQGLHCIAIIMMIMTLMTTEVPSTNIPLWTLSHKSYFP